VNSPWERLRSAKSSSDTTPHQRAWPKRDMMEPHGYLGQTEANHVPPVTRGTCVLPSRVPKLPKGG